MESLIKALEFKLDEAEFKKNQYDLEEDSPDNIFKTKMNWDHFEEKYKKPKKFMEELQEAFSYKVL